MSVQKISPPSNQLEIEQYCAPPTLHRLHRQDKTGTQQQQRDAETTHHQKMQNQNPYSIKQKQGRRKQKQTQKTVFTGRTTEIQDQTKN